MKILNGFSGNGEADAALGGLEVMTKLWVALGILEGSSVAASASVKARAKEEFKQTSPGEHYVAMFIALIKYVMRSNIPVSEIKKIEIQPHFAWLFDEHILFANEF